MASLLLVNDAKLNLLAIRESDADGRARPADIDSKRPGQALRSGHHPALAFSRANSRRTPDLNARASGRLPGPGAQAFELTSHFAIRQQS
jgi:hypothetical protein